MLQQNDKLTQSKLTFLEVSPIISNIKTTVNEGKALPISRENKRNPPQNEEAKRMHIFSVILGYLGRGRVMYTPVMRQWEGV